MQPGTATRPLGRSGIELPVLGLGGATIGNLHGPVSAADAAQVLDAAWQHGLRYFDTAPLYGRGLGELRVGQALRARPRDQFVLSTKVGWRFQPLARQAAPAGSLPFAARCDYSREGTLRSLEDSLLRLGLDRIDIAFEHLGVLSNPMVATKEVLTFTVPQRAKDYAEAHARQAPTLHQIYVSNLTVVRKYRRLILPYATADDPAGILLTGTHFPESTREVIQSSAYLVDD